MTEAPKITPADIEAEIATEATFNAGEALTALGIPHHERVALLTVCVLNTRNGFTVVGYSSPVVAANFSPEIGAVVARKHAAEQLWPLMGYTLLNRLAPGGDLHAPKWSGDDAISRTLETFQPVPGVYNDDMEGARPASQYPAHVQRMIAEYRELIERRKKLRDFIETPNGGAFAELPFIERDAMHDQAMAMQSYADVLLGRLVRAGVVEPLEVL